MKEIYRNGDYTMELSPNGSLWLVRKGNKCVATLDVDWIRRREDRWVFNPLWLLKGFLAWYYVV